MHVEWDLLGGQNKGSHLKEEKKNNLGSKQNDCFSKYSSITYLVSASRLGEINIQQICCLLWSNCYSTQSLANITHHWCFSSTQTVLVAATVLIFLQVWKPKHKKICKFAQVSHQDNNGGSPGKAKTSFSKPAITITLFWHLIHCNLNIALTNFIPKVSCKPADITSCFFVSF